jgi:methylenetetrahydrofolate dehydrogenase (NADP+)/methenyltetrahydrofolate cyclohydrolase
MSKIIDGKLLAEKLGKKLASEIGELKEKPLVVSILIGGDPNSLLYTQMKQKKAEQFNIDFLPMKFPTKSSFENVSKQIRILNNSPEVMGIMIQLPIPKDFLRGMHKSELINLINPDKDIDGMIDSSPYLSATVKGVMKILEYISSLRGPEGRGNLNEKSRESGSLRRDAPLDDNKWYAKQVFAVVGSEGEVGLPLVHELADRGAREIIRLDKRNPECNMMDLQKADVVISCTGVSGLVDADMVKDGVIAIDVGLGDFDPGVYEKAKMYTPKFGGVGPLTIISLMENILEAAGK